MFEGLKRKEIVKLQFNLESHCLHFETIMIERLKKRKLSNYNCYLELHLLHF